MQLAQLVEQKEREILRDNAYLSAWLNTLQSITEDIRYIICYGIGSIRESTISKHQLAFLLIVAKRLDCKVLIWDPVITDEEWTYYEKTLGFERARFPEAHQHALYYMPHCDLPVYDELLSCCLDIVVFGNDFGSYRLRDLKRFNEHAPCIRGLRYNTLLMRSSYIRNDVFNDCCFMFKFVRQST